jgi:hypothetical protein
METVAREAAAGTGIDSALRAKLLAHHLFRMTLADVPALRKLPSASAGRKSGSQTTLRYSDEQTIAATHAVLAAIQGMGREPRFFNDWGVLAATRYLGRAGLATAVQVFDNEGVWGVSPHLIPHFALHSASGTISLTLGIHGPNLGIGGGAHSATEGFLTALTWISARIVPGVWLILTGWTPEFVPGESETRSPATECLALAMAFSSIHDSTETSSTDTGLSARIVTSASGTTPEAPVNLGMLAEWLDNPQPLNGPRIIAANPDGSYRVELSQTAGKAR